MEELEQTQVEEVVEPQPEPEQIEQPSDEDMAQQLADAQAALKRQALEYDFYRKASAKGMSNIEKVMPFLDFSKVESGEGADQLGELIDILSQVSQAPKKRVKPLGEPTNGGSVPDKSAQAMLQEAGAKARKSGRIEDVAAFSALKQKLFGGKN